MFYFLFFILTLFWHFFGVHIFHFFYVVNVSCHFKNPLWVHNLLRIHPKFLWWFPLKYVKTWILGKLIMLVFNIVLNIMFICIQEKLQVWQSKLSTYSCFHPEHIFLVMYYLKFPFAHPISYNARITHILISKNKKTKRLHLHLTPHAKI